MAEEPSIQPPPGKVSNLENPEDALHTVNLATQVVCIIVVTVMTVLRVLIKIRLHGRLQLEDYMTVAGWVLFVGFCGNMLLLNAYGGGYHAWDVPKSQFVNFQKASYAVTILYVPMVFVIKLALLAVIRRIFRPGRQVLIINVSAVVLLLYYIPALFIKIFFCKPISAYWNGTADGGTCIDQRRVIIADSAISIASDLWILILPVPMLWSLQMSWMKKVRVMGILGAGGLATGFSVWRLVMMIEESETTDTTWFWIRCVLTGNAEAGIGLICACLPAVSAYFVSERNKRSKTASSSYHRHQSHYQLNSWNTKKSGNGNNININTLGSSSAFNNPAHCTDEAYLISSTVETVAAELRDGSTASSTLREGTNNSNDNSNVSGRDRAGGIHKNVKVTQSYEYVK